MAVPPENVRFPGVEDGGRGGRGGDDRGLWRGRWSARDTAPRADAADLRKTGVEGFASGRGCTIVAAEAETEAETEATGIDNSQYHPAQMSTACRKAASGSLRSGTGTR